jgi:hypothetical protein
VPDQPELADVGHVDQVAGVKLVQHLLESGVARVRHR